MSGAFSISAAESDPDRVGGYRPAAHGLRPGHRAAPGGRGRWEGEIVDGWGTPRGPLGGYVMAIVLRGLELAVDDRERSARSATMHFLRVPEPGQVMVEPRVERAGRSLTSVSARLEQDGKLLGHRPRRLVEAVAGAEASTRRRCPRSSRAEQRAPDRAGVPARQPPAFTEQALDAAPLRRAAVQRRGPAARPAAGSACSSERPIDALAIAVCADAWFPAPWPRLDRARAGADDRPDDPLPHRRCRSPTRCCSGAFATGWSATASSRRTASCGRRTARWSRSRGSSGC